MLNCWAVLLKIWEHTTYTLNYREIFWEYMAYMEYTLLEQRWKYACATSVVRSQFSRFSASLIRVMPTKNYASIKTICLINTLHFVYHLHVCQAMPYTIAEYATLFDFGTHSTTQKNLGGVKQTHIQKLVCTAELLTWSPWFFAGLK